jgi:peptide/nickel transport system permease protein
MKTLLRHKPALISFFFLILLILACFAANPLAEALGMTPGDLDLKHVKAPPSLHHLLGTDELGRDLLLRLLAGGRVSLSVSIAAALASALIGTTIGITAGFYGGAIDAALMRLTDGVLALPILPVLIVLSAVDLTKLGVAPSVAQSGTIALYRIIVIVTLFGWTVSARLVRGSTLSLKQRDYVTAARALGLGNFNIMRRHILPNLASPLLIATTLSVGYLILTESVLSFLGLGIQPPAASWGNMLTNAQEMITDDPRLAIWPGLMIFLTVIAFNFLGDGLQDSLNPRETRRA